MSDDGKISALERFAKLRDNGALTEAEFAAQKAKLLGTVASHVRFYRRLWVVVLLTCLLITFPLSLLILVTGDVYRRAKAGSWVPIKRTTRYVYAGLLGLWFTALVIKILIVPDTVKREWVESGNKEKPTMSATSQAAATDANAPDKAGTVPAPGLTPDTGAAAQPSLTEEMPADETAFVQRRDALVKQLPPVPTGTRAEDEALHSLVDLISSMDGKTVTDWTCTMSPGGGGYGELYCLSTPGDDPYIHFDLWLEDKSLIPERTYPGDVFKFSGTVHNREKMNLAIQVTAFAITKKGP